MGKSIDDFYKINTINPNRLTLDELKTIAKSSANDEFIILSMKQSPVSLGMFAVERMLSVAHDADNVAMLYADHYSVENGKREKHPVIDYQAGSIRDDFDFGQIVVVRTTLIKKYLEQDDLKKYEFAQWYDLRLFLSINGSLFHLNEYLYTEEELDTRASGVKQFDYVDPRNRNRQIELEEVATRYLEKIGAMVDTAKYDAPDYDAQEFECEASVVIPVYNREKTIADAVGSALSQEADFKFNVIVVDNHSTDKTTEILNGINDERLVHIIPERTDLGIGGCWNAAVSDSRCGRFAIQLDSDDLYSSPKTIARIVEEFRKQKAAMMIGSYRMCDFELNTLPPGLIDHKEWTDKNGANNALRINGLGAPRAFFTPLIRQIKFPNTSYGEDYAVGLAISRRHRIGRIYDELYLCRRWNGNSDAALDIEHVNANNTYKDRLRTIEIAARKHINNGNGENEEDSFLTFFSQQLSAWDDCRQHFADLKNVKTKNLTTTDDSLLKLQFNPARMVSTGAKIDKKSLAKRPCFLCDENRPKEQSSLLFDDKLKVLVNPYPILPQHFTLPAICHTKQNIGMLYAEMRRVLTEHKSLMAFYNGPKCGASAPDHAHLQMGTSGLLPLQTEWGRLSRNMEKIASYGENDALYLIKDFVVPVFAIRTQTAEGDSHLFDILYSSLEKFYAKPDEEPMMNIVAWYRDNDYVCVVIPRMKHRPDCYFKEGKEQILVSPGALDMAGMIITPREKDFNGLSAVEAESILKECGITNEDADKIVALINDEEKRASQNEDMTEPMVTVGIVSGSEIHFTLNKPYLAKGEKIEGEQIAQFSEGGILWNGSRYQELQFIPSGNDASFTLSDVTIGVNFHWERKEAQTFVGNLKLVVDADKICAINELSVERYLESVISSEMKASASLELLKAHTVISRSWLLAQMEKRKRLSENNNVFFSFIKKDDELIRWYDREDHLLFDVCADDHCQRYQGITRETSKNVAAAVKATKGQVLMSKNEDGETEICDARFSKCCGGISEEYQYCWEDMEKTYLKAVKDDASDASLSGKDEELLDLTVEANAEKWIRSNPDAFCNTDDAKVLKQVLNDYDTETHDFYRWKVEYTTEELTQLVSDNLKIDFGEITDLQPLERGKSGRISRLRIVGKNRSFVLGKELEIRRALSTSHLYSSAFVVDKKDGKFILTGAGWGHGVGLCQIGAAVMGEQGYDYSKILLHYYKNAEITKIY
ncbi:MAG: DUF4922 domain-containing protein [Prevotella sp.]|nr:DUF4922 domain-containing protein [Prevotella sp.]